MKDRRWLEETLLTCTVCPGICILECPVYRSTYRRAAAPHVIGRMGLRVLRSEASDKPANIYYCTGCGACRDYCPVSNDLPEAARILRGILSEAAEGRLRLETLSSGDKVVAIISPKRPGEQLVKALSARGYSVYWADSREASRAYWLGGQPSLDLEIEAELVVSEDLELELEASDPIGFIESLGLRVRRPPAYVLHVPCRDRTRSLYEKARALLGEPAAVIQACSGAPLGWGAPSLARILSSKLASESRGLPVITGCAWSALSLRRAGAPAYTILDLVEG